MRKHVVLIAAVAAVFAVATFNVQAAPFAPVKAGVDASHVLKVAGGCGRGRHHGPRGRCVPN